MVLTMRTLRLILPIVCIGIYALQLVQTSPVPEESYPTKYDGIDYKSILKSKRLLTNYTKCLTSEGPCTAEGKMLLELLPDAIATKCRKCNEKQKSGTLDVIEILQKEHPDSWKILQGKWDPDDNLTEPLLEQIRKELGRS